MSHDVKLGSQTQLFEALQLFTQFNSNLISVEGDTGSGKSWLAQHFLNSDKEIQTLSFLLCLPSQTTKQQRCILMGQLLADSLCGTDETLTQSLEHYRKDQECNTTLIVDDADLLCQGLLSELCELIVTAQNNPLWQVNVILFSKPGALDQKLSVVAQLPDIKSIIIPPFNDEDTQTFLEQLVVPHAKKDKQRIRIYQIAEKIDHTPGKLLALAEPYIHNSHWMRRFLLVLIALLIAMGGWSWWTSYQSRIDDQKNDAMLISQPQIKPEQSLTDSEPASSAQATLPNTQPVKLEDDAKNLPPEVMEKTVSVGEQSADNQKRVVVSAKVVDALVDGDNSVGNKSTVENTSAVVANNAVATSGDKSSATAITSLVLNTDELLNISEDRYTLQLAAVTSKQEALGFINQFSLQHKVRVYRTIRNQKQWFVVTYQDFATIQKTSEAAQDLPINLQKELPWPKSMAQVQQEILRAK
ncbi:AAA family ATPase [Vibrio sp. S11_S32]|uniref:SPOR domain-containing protein n=1 Tax=Vibrio sp. S11_S32 TaxID=2720225 RepID=UPI001681B205|nr:AAA family ATPase [Vibrio sp. S11_S32]MBD1576826.1 AAA family ATPase [Vibrio sp. S11_S32]